MTDKEILEIVSKEIKDKTWGVTEEFLKIHDVVYHDGYPVISHIDRDKENTVIAYVQVKDEYFFFAIYIDTIEKKVSFVYDEARSTVKLIATSETLTSDELQALTKLPATNQINKGENVSYGAKLRKYNFSAIHIEPNPEADETEDKVKKLIDYLLQDKEGISVLVEQADDVWMDIRRDCHHGNQMLGGVHFEPVDIKKIAELGIGVDIDVWAWGNGWESYKKR